MDNNSQLQEADASIRITDAGSMPAKAGRNRHQKEMQQLSGRLQAAGSAAVYPVITT